METKNMKTKKNSLFGALKWVLGACMVFAGVQSAVAKCAGELYFKAPEGWTSAYVYLTQQSTEMTLGAGGYFHIDLATAEQQAWGDDQMVFKVISGASYPVNFASSSIWNGTDQYSIDNNTADIHCPGMGKSLYLYENPSKPGTSVVSENPPDAKYFYIMIPPEFEEWMSSVPMLSLDGGQTGIPMTADPDKCGWYYHVFFDEKPTDHVLLFRDDDETREDMLGLNGNWETGNATEIPLEMLFGMVDTLFFVPDEAQLKNPGDDGFYYSAKDIEDVEGTCTYTLAAVIYDTDPSLHPAFSCFVDGGEGVNNFNADCQRGAQGVSEQDARKALQTCLGVTQGMVNPILGPDKKPHLSGSKASTDCFINEAFFSQMFNNTPFVNEMTCYDMPFKRSADGRWEFDSDYDMTTNGAIGGFAPVENTTDEIVLAAGSTPLPAARTKHAAQGPAALYTWLQAKDPVENMPIFDLMCNGPGWKGGLDCDGHFEGGNDLNGEVFYGTTIENVWCWGDYCLSEIPANWPTFVKGTEKPVAKTAKTAAPRWESGDPGAAYGAVAGSLGRNQHFCFESHAQFTYKKGLRFNFRGDDDIWVYIGGKLAVDLGGTHMAAPAYVNLDLVTDAQGLPLEVGSQYDLDIFFCDRRTTMSNVRITTNMYIMQKTDISFNKTNLGGGNSKYEMCYNKSGDGSCAAALSGSDESIHCCGDEIATVCGVSISYVLVQGRVYGAEGAETRDPKTVNGINLDNPTNPMIDKEKAKSNLPPGLWTLFAVVDGKAKKIDQFRATGDVDVVYGDAVAIDFDENDVEIGRRNYKFVGSAMGGPAEPTLDDMIPVYISAIAGEEAGKVVMQPIDARGVSYTLDVPAGMSLYRKDGTPVLSGESLVVGESGVDTLYAYVSLMAMRDSIQTFELKVSGSSKNKPAVLTFYLPILSFVDSTGTPIEPGYAMLPTDKEHWVGQYYPFYLQALKPLGEGKAEPCDNCNFSFSLSSETSPRIEVQSGVELKFEKGKAKFTARSRVEYRGDNFAKIVVVGDNPLMLAECWPLYFREPPVPTPVLADVFDVNGADAAKDLVKMADTYKKSKYLDGIGDSVAIYYHRDIHKDSLPLAICLMWDSVSATTYNPIQEGWSNQDSAEVRCNAVVKSSEYRYGAADASGYCGNRIEIGGAASSLALSEKVKTSGIGTIISYAEFIDLGDTIRQGFDFPLTDRIAPVPVSATIVPQAGNENYSNLTIVLSEPVKLLDASNLSSLDFYLNSASDDANRMMSPTYGVGNAITSVGAATVSAEGSKGKVSALFCTNPKTCPSSSTPQEGDYVRLGGNIAKAVWSDAVDLSADTSTVLLRPSEDLAYSWNAPTGYEETARLPSPWVLIGGRTPAYIFDVNFAHTGNAQACMEATPSICSSTITPFIFSSLDDKKDIIDGVMGLPGQLVTSNMMSLYYQILEGDDNTPGAEVDMDDFYFAYDVEYYTNLGAYVAGSSGKIYCKDELNLQNNGRYFFGGKDCTEEGTYIYLGWNMRSDNGREVGTGAYITKVDTYVRINGSKLNHKDETSVFGIKKSKDPYTKTWDDFKKNHNLAN